MVDAQEIGRRMRARRERLDKTQSDIAQALHVETATYSRYESGKIAVSSPDMARVAALLGVSVGYFYDDEDSRTQEEIVYEPIMDELRAAAYSGILDGEFVEEIAEDIRRQHERRARRQGRA